MKRSWLSAVYILSVLTALFLSYSRAGAQAIFGNIAGTVTDPSGKRIVEARVIVTSLGTGVIKTATTNDAGIYAVTSLSTGN